MFGKLNEIFSGIDRELSIKQDNLEFAPIFLNGTEVEYLLLKEAIEFGKLTVIESNDVSSLLVANQMDLPVLIIEGEELIGGRQNRVVTKTVLVKGNSKVRIPVACVEKRRWDYRSSVTVDFDDTSTRRNRRRRRQESDVFVASRIIDTSIRSTKLFSMMANARASREIKANQEEVWCAVDESLLKAGVTSSTDAAYEAYLKKKKEFESLKKTIKPMEGQSGFAVFVNDSFYGLEYLSNPEKFEKYFDSIIDSYLMDLTDYNSARPLRRNRGLPGEPERIITEKSASLGENIYISWKNHIGHGLVYEEEFLHFSVLPVRIIKMPRFPSL